MIPSQGVSTHLVGCKHLPSKIHGKGQRRSWEQSDVHHDGLVVRTISPARGIRNWPCTPKGMASIPLIVKNLVSGESPSLTATDSNFVQIVDRSKMIPYLEL